MSALHLTIGIDPGQTGAIAALADGDFEAVVDMPLMDRVTKGNEVDGAQLAGVLREIRGRHPGAAVLVVMEQVNAMPAIPNAKGIRVGMGSTSAFNFGEGFGVIKGVIAALGMPMVLTAPQKWKKEYGLIRKPKDLARTIAARRFPVAVPLLKRVKDSGRADAILIADWGRRTEQYAIKLKGEYPVNGNGRAVEPHKNPGVIVAAQGSLIDPIDDVGDFEAATGVIMHDVTFDAPDPTREIGRRPFRMHNVVEHTPKRRTPPPSPAPVQRKMVDDDKPF